MIGPVKQKRIVPLSVRLSPELNKRLEETAERLKVTKHSLAQLAIESAVEAVEKNDNRLVFPIGFEVTHRAAPATAQPAKSPDLIKRGSFTDIVFPKPGEQAAPKQGTPPSSEPGKSSKGSPIADIVRREFLGKKGPRPK